VIAYREPRHWIRYDALAVMPELIEAKAALVALRSLPFQRRWVEALQQVELKREVAGTSRIEGAVLTERELDAAMRETPDALFTRSQRQAHAAVRTYRWIATLPADYPLTVETIFEIHRQIVMGADDDHCPPGVPRERDHNVTFGVPPHRGVEGGPACTDALARFASELQHAYRGHDPLVQAFAAHYHFAAMHPFLDGNGRTARALEALLLGRAGLRDSAFIAMSNYYYDEKARYLAALADTRQHEHDLTGFLKFALTGVALQCQRLCNEIRREISKELCRSFARELFSRLTSPRKRALADRQVKLLEHLLEAGGRAPRVLEDDVESIYRGLKNPGKAFDRDLILLVGFGAVNVQGAGESMVVSANLDWPTLINDMDSFRAKFKMLPLARTTLYRPADR
jgi:Fic family protein